VLDVLLALVEDGRLDLRRLAAAVGGLVEVGREGEVAARDAAQEADVGRGVAVGGAHLGPVEGGVDGPLLLALDVLGGGEDAAGDVEDGADRVDDARVHAELAPLAAPVGVGRVGLAGPARAAGGVLGDLVGEGVLVEARREGVGHLRDDDDVLEPLLVRRAGLERGVGWGWGWGGRG
jgi:hypothetical protein